jgi:hypothetical protein
MPGDVTCLQTMDILVVILKICSNLVTISIICFPTVLQHVECVTGKRFEQILYTFHILIGRNTNKIYVHRPSQPTSAPTVRNNAGETTLSPTESTRSPTQHPSKSPTTSPSSKPSSKPSSSPTRSKILPDVPSCQDNSDYINPIDESQGGCEFFAQFTNDDGGCDCSIWEFFLQDPLDILGMYMNCPATCNVSCEEPIITTDAPTSAPFECFDDRNYVNPIPFLDGDGCNAFETVDCTTLSFLAADVYEALLRSCPVSCDLCG